jgi:hypothetical protein
MWFLLDVIFGGGIKEGNEAERGKKDFQFLLWILSKFGRMITFMKKKRWLFGWVRIRLKNDGFPILNLTVILANLNFVIHFRLLSNWRHLRSGRHDGGSQNSRQQAIRNRGYLNNIYSEPWFIPSFRSEIRSIWWENIRNLLRKTEYNFTCQTIGQFVINTLGISPFLIWTGEQDRSRTWMRSCCGMPRFWLVLLIFFSLLIPILFTENSNTLPFTQFIQLHLVQHDIQGIFGVGSATHAGWVTTSEQGISACLPVFERLWLELWNMYISSLRQYWSTETKRLRKIENLFLTNSLIEHGNVIWKENENVNVNEIEMRIGQKYAKINRIGFLAAESRASENSSTREVANNCRNQAERTETFRRVPEITLPHESMVRRMIWHVSFAGASWSKEITRDEVREEQWWSEMMTIKIKRESQKRGWITDEPLAISTELRVWQLVSIPGTSFSVEYT